MLLIVSCHPCMPVLRSKVIVPFLLLLTAVGHQIYCALHLIHNDSSSSLLVEWQLPSKQQSTTSSFSACLLIQDDNALLSEWLAYHYTILPLRHIVVGVDVHSIQDPRPILERWRDHTDLEYSILPLEAFVNRYPSSRTTAASSLSTTTHDEKQHHHHELIRRQKGFLSACTEYLQQQGAHWTAFIDTDEYVLPNRLGVHDEHLVIDGHDHSSMKNVSYQIRRHLPRLRDESSTYTTVADVLIQLQNAGFVKSCYTLPRLLVGALENRTCADAQQDHQRFPQLSTLRYFQHSIKGDFQTNKFGKVFMDLSQIPVDIVQNTIPRNIHRPYKDYCGPGSVHFPDSYFYLNHYIGSWERYSSRSSDKRRNREEWEKRAFLDDGMTPACESAIYEWLPRFVHQVGGNVKAKYLLNGGD